MTVKYIEKNILRMMQYKPVTLSHLAELLKADGHDLTLIQIENALQRLRRNKRINNTNNRNVWCIGEKPRERRYEHR
jgi:hypothetical protein